MIMNRTNTHTDMRCCDAGDLKLENLMLVTPEDDSPVKVIDFGMMVQLPEHHHIYTGTSAVGSPGVLVCVWCVLG
jgi:hypothetical protein